MKNETTLTAPAPVRYRALYTVAVRNPETGRTVTYTKGKVVKAEVWNTFSSATKQRFEAVVTREVKAPVLENTLHYRFMVADLEIVLDQAKLAPGEVPAWAIIREENVRALELFRPKLTRSEVARRHLFVDVEAECIAGALAIGRNVDFNWSTFHNTLRAKFPANYNDNWDTSTGHDGTVNFPVLDAEAAAEFRSAIRPLIEAATREIFPSSATA
jgi:hypothetical protein